MPTVTKDEHTVVEFTAAEFAAVLQNALPNTVDLPDMEEEEDLIRYVVTKTDGQSLNFGTDATLTATLRDVE